MQGVTSSYNAFYKEDKFSKAHWTTHLGVFAAGFANGALAGGFEKGKGKIFKLFKAEDVTEYQAGIEFFARGIGVTAEFSMSAFAKSNYKYLSYEGYWEKAGNSLPKLIGYLLATYH